MIYNISNIKISQILSVIPKSSFSMEEEIKLYDYPEKRIHKLSNVMGYGKHRLVDKENTTSDLAVYGISYLVNNGYINKNDVDALIFVSVTHDHIMPGTSSIIQGRLGLKNNIYCVDINQACSGYVTGLIQACMILDTSDAKKVVLINGDTLSKKVSEKDRFAYLLIGDACTITVIEKGEDNITASFHTDGVQYESLIIPAGGFRIPANDNTKKVLEAEDGNFRSQEQLFMDGINVYNYALDIVTENILSLMKYKNLNDSDIFAYCFHQPNKFILNKMAHKMNVDKNKMPSNIIGEYGNTSSATIPLVITHNYSGILQDNKYTFCMVGFGAGLMSAFCFMDIGYLDVCEIIEYDKEI